MTGLISAIPVLDWPSGQAQTVQVTPTLRAGRTLADWASFVLTIRSDPLWPRTGIALAERAFADPDADGWPLALTVTGTVSGSVVNFVFAVPTPAGYQRYAIDVWAVGGADGDVQFVPPTLLTVGGSVR